MVMPTTMMCPTRMGFVQIPSNFNLYDYGCIKQELGNNSYSLGIKPKNIGNSTTRIKVV